MTRLKFGQFLIQQGLINEESLNKAIKLQERSGEKLGTILIDMGIISETQTLNALAQHSKIPFIDLYHYDVKSDYVLLLPENYARRFKAIVLDKQNNIFIVGMADPDDVNAFDSIAKILRSPIRIAVISASALDLTIDRIYRRTQEITNFAQELSEEIVDGVDQSTDDLFDESIENEEQAPVVKLLNSLFRDAIQARASDIHIEPDEESLRIRFRIDGILHENILSDKRIVSALIQRLKLRANLDIAEKRIPQDGRFNFISKGQSFDVRVSTLPISHGEAVVMRLLNQSSTIADLDSLGIPAPIVRRLENIYTKPTGMLLVTGPTGSGKTTTLYSILNKLNMPERKILTVEDPVEYRISRINQVQVNPKIDLTFARVLRAMLRQDPDVIMVGEIRDNETAQIALRAAITGHFVLATLHTNDAITTAIRLIDMGLEGYMVAAAVKGIIGQRLIRTLCNNCTTTAKPNVSELMWLEDLKIDSNQTFKIGAGCSYCNYHGYVGRMGIHELLELDKDMLIALRNNDSERFVQVAMNSSHFKPLAKVAGEAVVNGLTSIAEAIRVIGQVG